MYVGIEIWHNDRLSNTTHSEYLKTQTDIRDSTIEKIKTYIPQNKINLQESNIGEIVTSSNIDILHSWEGSTVRRLTINKKIALLKVEDSSFEVMRGKKNCEITELSVTNSSLVHAYELFEINIKSQNSDSLMIISESYKNSRNREKQYEYSYLYQKKQTNNITGKFKKVTRKIMELTCGYGYKPERGVYFLFYVWALFSILYAILSLFDGYGLSTKAEKIQGISSIFYSMYFSVITFTTIGFGDVTPLDWITRALSGIEGILGVSTLAIIIYALTKHE